MEKLSAIEVVKQVKLLHFFLVVICAVFGLFLLTDNSSRILVSALKELNYIEALIKAWSKRPIHSDYDDYRNKQFSELSVSPVPNTNGYAVWTNKNQEEIAEKVRINPVYDPYNEQHVFPKDLPAFIDFWDTTSNGSHWRVITELELTKGIISLTMAGNTEIYSALFVEHEEKPIPYLMIKNISREEQNEIYTEWEREQRPDIPPDTYDEFAVELSIEPGIQYAREKYPVERITDITRKYEINEYADVESSVEHFVLEKNNRFVWNSEFYLDCYSNPTSTQWREWDLGTKHENKTTCNQNPHDPFSPVLEFNLGFPGVKIAIGMNYLTFLSSRDSWIDTIQLGTFDKSFPNLHQIILKEKKKSLNSLSIYIEDKIKALELQTVKIPVLGLDIPNNRKYEIGLALILVFLLNLLMHLGHLNNILSNESDAWQTPWIGLYTSILSRLTLIITTIVIPFVLFLSIGIIYSERLFFNKFSYIATSMIIIGMALLLLLANQIFKLFKHQIEYRYFLKVDPNTSLQKEVPMSDRPK